MSVWSPSLFDLVVDDLSRCIQDRVLYISANNNILVDKIKAEINYILELQREVLESKGLKLSRSKPKYLECNLILQS